MAGDPIEQRVIQLETLLTHQDHLIQELNDAVVEVRSEFRQLQAQFEQQRRQLQSLTDRTSSADAPVDEKPPHY